MTRTIRTVSLVLAAAAVMLATDADAATVGYWRFEGDRASPAATQRTDGNFLDDGNSPDSAASEVDLFFADTEPTKGAVAGTAFPDPVPQTGLSNAGYANFGTSQAGHFFAADEAALSVTDFTIEAFIRKGVQTTGTQYVASQWATGSNQRSWAFGVAGTNDIGSIAGSANDLFLSLSDAGTDANIVASGVNIDVGDDYYVAVSFDQSDLAGGVTFYIQNLTDNTAMLVVTKAHPIATLHDATGNLNIGTFNNSGTSRWTGFLDEVRLSNSVLAQTQLLAVPAPAALPAGLALLALAGLRRRR